jgi:hypothetical protein
MKTFPLFGLLILVCSCEYNDISEIDVNKEVEGVWTLEQIYSNEYWGGPYSWKAPYSNKQVKFTGDLKYFSKTTGDFELIGTYQKLSDTVMLVTWDKPPTSNLTYKLNFSIGTTGRLTLQTGLTGGTILEKYKRTK